MKKIGYFLMVGLTFAVLNVSTVAAQTDSLPMADSSAAPIGEGGEAGGPVATDMSGKMINDGGHGANSGRDAEERSPGEQACVDKLNAKAWYGSDIMIASSFSRCIISAGGDVIAECAKEQLLCTDKRFWCRDC
jgi:hypothetical protein